MAKYLQEQEEVRSLVGDDYEDVIQGLAETLAVSRRGPRARKDHWKRAAKKIAKRNGKVR